MALPSGDDLFFSPLTELVARLRKREFSAVELTKAYCDRLEKLGPGYNALALSLRKGAIDKAKDVDWDIKRERFRSPLHGVPYGAKDLLSAAGQTTGLGRRALRAAGLRGRRDRGCQAGQSRRHPDG
jgi:aspartyl-tRNA(Asn)/glutamyl-tRNA(Gln) amidotransferase subunit A